MNHLISSALILGLKSPRSQLLNSYHNLMTIFWFIYLHGDLVNESLLGRILLMTLTFLFDSQLLERFVSIEWEISSHRLKALFNLKNWETPMEQTKLRMVILELSFLINKFDH